MAVTTRSRFWGPLWADVWDVPGKRFWGPLWPDPGPPLDHVAPIGPAGVATFVADLDSALDLTLEWQTDVLKSYDGQEKRAAVLDDPRRRIAGSALLIGGASVRTLRTQLARHAALGATFLLGLPFESLLLTADSIGTTLTVSGLTLVDWANPGQRVVVLGRDRTALDAVVQSASGTAIVLDVAPGNIGRAGGTVMPTVPIFLEPQQGFERYRNPEGFERWKIAARAASFCFQKQAVAAVLYLDGSMGVPPLGGSGGLEGVIFQARTAGIAGNDIRVALDDQSLGGVDINESGTDITIHFEPQPGGSTVGDLVAAVNATSELVKVIGTWTPTSPLESNDDEFPLTFLDGGGDGAYVNEGTGATIAMHAGRPVFDRGLVVSGETGTESLQAMNEVIDLGGTLANIGQTQTPDWGRHVAMNANWDAEWQWIKRFLRTVRGRQVAFWLPTWRNDLDAVSSSVDTLTIEGPSDGDGGFFTWYPARDTLQIVQADGTITRATITDALDNDDGTIALTIGVTLSASPITMVSWLELCRFEDDTINVRFADARFVLSTTARVVTR